jgi:hypothetical protein
MATKRKAKPDAAADEAEALLDKRSRFRPSATADALLDWLGDPQYLEEGFKTTGYDLFDTAPDSKTKTKWDALLAANPKKVEDVVKAVVRAVALRAHTGQGTITRKDIANVIAERAGTDVPVK